MSFRSFAVSALANTINLGYTTKDKTVLIAKAAIPETKAFIADVQATTAALRTPATPAPIDTVDHSLVTQ